MLDIVSFEDLEIDKNVNIIDACVKHSAQAGSIFGRRKAAHELVEKATDYVKYLKGKIGTECRTAGEIPGISKMTDKALEDYINQLPEMVKARTERAEAIGEYDNVLGLVTNYNSNKDMLALIRAERKDEQWSDPSSSRAGDVGYSLN